MGCCPLMTDKSAAQLAAEQQQETPWYVCSECGEVVIVFNGRVFRTCECEPMNIVLTLEGVKRGASGI